jgi:hypothetical protein
MIIFDLFEDNNKKPLAEFAPSDSNNGDDGFSEETLKQLAAQWYNGDEDPEVERTLMAAGWEIGQDEGYDDEPGVFVVQAGDVNGNSYISWPADELRQGVAEGTLNELAGYSSNKAYQSVEAYKRYDVYVSRKKFNNIAFIAVAENPRTRDQAFKAQGNTPQEAVDNLKAEIDREIDTATKVSGQAILDFNVDFVRTILELSSETFYAKIVPGPRLVIAGSEMMQYPDIMKSEGFKPSSIRTSNSTEGTTPLPGVSLSSKAAVAANLIANGRYVLGDETVDRDGNRVFDLNFDSVVQASNDKMRLRVPAVTVGTNRSPSVTEGQYEIHHLDPEGRRKAIYHHGRGYTDDVVRKDTQYHQKQNPRDTFQVFKDKQPFDWQGVEEGKKRKKKKASKSLGRYFFPGYGYYGSGESGEGGGDGGGGESVNRSVAEAIREKGALKAAQDAAKFIIRNLDDRNALRNYSANFWSPEKFYQGATMAMRPGISVDDIAKAIKQDRPAQFEGMAESLEDYERYQYIVTLKSGKRIRFLCGEDCDVKTYIERKYNEPVVDIKDQGIVGEPPVELLPGEKNEGLKSTLGAAALATTMALGAGGAQGRVMPGDDPNINRLTGQPIATQKANAPVDQEVKAPVASKGFSKEYLQKAADPNRFGRYLISIEKAQELLNQLNEVSPEYIKRYKKEHGRRATAADQAGDYAKGHEHFKKINKLTKQQFQRGAKPEKVDEISNFMTLAPKPVSPEEQWKRQIRLLAKQYQTNASSLAALARENGPDSAEAVAYEYLRNPSKIRVPGTAAPASTVNWDDVIRRLPMGLSGMALLQAAEEYLINNRGMLRSTVRSLLNNDENQRTLSAAYAKKKTPAESVTEESDNEAVEQAIVRRIMVGRTDLLLKYGPKKVMQAVEDVADYVGSVDEIGSSDVSGWVRQVEQVLGQ